MTTTQTILLDEDPLERGVKELVIQPGNGRRVLAVGNVAASLATATRIPAGRDGSGRFAHFERISGMVIERTPEQARASGASYVRGEHIITEAFKKMRLVMRNARVGLAVVPGCLNSEDVAKAWESIQPFEAARLAQLLLQETMPGATRLAAERDEAHMYTPSNDGAAISERGSGQARTAYNIAFNIPNDMVRVRAAIAGLSGDLFSRFDDYMKEQVSMTKDNTSVGGFLSTESPSAKLTGRISLSGGEMVAFMNAACDAVENGNGMAPLTYFDVVALIQSYLYVISLGVTREMLDSEMGRVRSYTDAFYRAARSQIVALVREETSQVHDMRQYFEVLQPTMPAVWMYVYVCICFERVTFRDGAAKSFEEQGGEGIGTLTAIKDKYIPLCETREVQGSGTSASRSQSYLFEAQVSSSGNIPVISQIMVFNWYKSQLERLVGGDAIVSSDSLRRETISSVGIILPAEIGEDKMEDISNYIADSKGHFESRLRSHGIEKYVAHLLNCFLTSNEIPGILHPGDNAYEYLVKRTGGYVTQGTTDCLKTGIASMSTMMFSSGIAGIANMRMVLESTTSPNVFDTHPNFCYSTDAHALEQSANLMLNSMLHDPELQAETTIANDGRISVVLGYDRAFLQFQKEKLLLVVDGGISQRISNELNRRVESVQYRGYSASRADGMKENSYDKGAAVPKAFGVSAMGNVQPDDESHLLHGLLMTVPAGNLRNLYELWKNGGSHGQTFSEFMQVDRRSVEYLNKLPDITLRYLKMVLPVTNEHTGLMEVLNVFSRDGVYAISSRTGAPTRISAKGETDVADGAHFTYAAMGLEEEALSQSHVGENTRPFRQEVSASTSGISMQIATMYVEELNRTQEGQMLKQDLINLVYDLWRRSAAEPKGGLLDLIEGNAYDPFFAREYLRAFYESQFVQMVARQGFERQTYGLAAHDAIMIRLVLGMFMTLQTAEEKLRSGLSLSDIDNKEKDPRGPDPEHALMEASRRNMKAVLSRQSQIPSFAPGVGGLSVYIATTMDMAVLLTHSGPSSMRDMFEYVQKLAYARDVGAGVIEDDIQRRQTYVNAITHWAAITASDRSGGRSYMQNPMAGREIGNIHNPGFGSGGLEALKHVGDLESFEYSQGLAGDKLIKINEGGQVVIGADTLARQMLSLQATVELLDPKLRGQIAMVATGMLTVYTALIWSYPEDSRDGRILGRRVYVDSNVRFSSKLLRGRNKLHDMRVTGISKEIAQRGVLRVDRMLAPTASESPKW